MPIFLVVHLENIHNFWHIYFMNDTPVLPEELIFIKLKVQRVFYTFKLLISCV